MFSTRAAMSVGLFGLVIWAITAASPAATAGTSAAAKPVIAPPVAVPSRPLPGKRFAVSFRVTRSDTRAPLTRGVMIATPSIAGRVMPHSESFGRGTARLSLVIPLEAQGKLLKVTLTIKDAGSSATRTASFRIPALPKPSLSIADATVVEGSGTEALSFRIDLSARTPLSVTVRYASSDGTAIAGTDYTASVGSVTFKPGQTTALILVTPVADSVFEPDETMTVTLSQPVNGTLADRTATGTITNDDVAMRSGSYTGSTSQWTYIAFDVAEGASSLSGLFFFADLTCDTPLNELRNVKIELWDPIPVSPEGRFAITRTIITQTQISLTVSFEGKLTAPSSASGVLRVVDMTSNEPPFFGAHCRNDVTWTAAAA